MNKPIRRSDRAIRREVARDVQRFCDGGRIQSLVARELTGEAPMPTSEDPVAAPLVEAYGIAIEAVIVAKRDTYAPWIEGLTTSDVEQLYGRAIETLIDLRGLVRARVGR